MTELTGWLLDVYAGEGGLFLWLLGDDDRRYRLRQRAGAGASLPGGVPA